MAHTRDQALRIEHDLAPDHDEDMRMGQRRSGHRQGKERES